MNMFARFDENPAKTLQVIKETKRYGRTHGRTNGIHTTNKVGGVGGGGGDAILKPVLNFVFVLFVLLLYVPGQQLWSWQDGQFT